MPPKTTPGPYVTFKALGGPFDGDQIPMPLSSLKDEYGLPQSKAMVLQDNRGQIGKLSKYFFSIQRRQAIFQGTVQVAPDGES